MTWRSHWPLIKVYLLHTALCSGFVYYMVQKHGPSDLRTFINLGSVALAVLIGPALLLHLYHTLLCRTTRVVIADRTVTIINKGQSRSFQLDDIRSLTACKSFPLAENRMQWMAWDPLCYWDIVIQGEEFRISSLTVRNLEELIVVPVDRYRLKKRFMPIP